MVGSLKSETKKIPFFSFVEDEKPSDNAQKIPRNLHGVKRGPRRFLRMASKQSVAESSSNFKAPKRKIARKNASNVGPRYNPATTLASNINNDYRDEHSE